MTKSITIRGARLLKVLNEDVTYPGLYREIQRGFPTTKRREHATHEVAVSKMQYVPVARGLQVNAQARSNTHDYAPSILFLDVAYDPDETAGGTSFTGSDGKVRHMQPIDLTMSTCKVKCNCLDFFYRFAQTNYDDDALLGKKPPLYKRVPGSTRDSANPQHVPGVCRHLIKVVELLRRYGMVK